jgi:hypothetical protein
MSFWQYARERWLWIVMVASGWAIFWFGIVPLFPLWFGIVVSAAVWLHLAYQLGVLRTQAGWMRKREREAKHERAETEAIFRAAAEAVRGLGQTRAADILDRGVTERRH